MMPGGAPLGLATVIAGCLNEPPGPSINQVEWEVPPVTLEWVGRYVGSASGTFDGEEKEDVEVQVVITFDQPPEPDCSSVMAPSPVKANACLMRAIMKLSKGSSLKSRR